MEPLKYFYCYDSKLYKLFEENGLKFICRGIHPASKQLFSQYVITEQLEKLIDEYKCNKVKLTNL